MRLVDSHCHLDSPRILESERAGMLQRAASAGVMDIVVPGVHPATWIDIQRLSQNRRSPTEPRLYPCAGIHPQVLPELDDRAVADGLDQLLQLAHGGVVAIGETGLDRPTAKADGGALERQLEVFQAHLDIASQAGLPVVVHCFRWHDQLLALLRRRGGHPPGLILHSFSGSAELVPHYLELGGWFSFAGPVTYPNARRPLAALTATPLDRLLLETDAPDQTPAPHRGKRNEPAFLPLIAARAADLLGMPLSEVAACTTRNARTCYRLDTWKPGTGTHTGEPVPVPEGAR